MIAQVWTVAPEESKHSEKKMLLNSVCYYWHPQVHAEAAEAG